MNIAVFVLYTYFVAYASLTPMDSGPLGPWDKVGHLLIYAVFAWLGHRLVSNARHYLYLCTGIIIYSGLMEVAQSYIPGRMMSSYDFLANTVGVFIGALLSRTLFRAKST
jgi:VanZ family protein